MRAFVAFVIAWITLIVEVSYVVLCEWGFQYAPSWAKFGANSYSVGIGFMLAIVGFGIALTGVLACAAVLNSKD